MPMKYFLYRHVRLDTNQVFYVGIGKKPPINKIWKFRTEYARAFEKAKRSQYWKNVVAKTEYRVDILFETDDKNIICQKEIEFIALYGKKCDNKGPLVNLSDGGELTIGAKHFNVRVTQLNLDNSVVKVWDQIKDIQTELGYLKTNIVKCCRHKQLAAYGFKWAYTDNRKYDSIWPSAARSKGSSNNRVGIKVTDTRNKTEYLFRTQSEVAAYFKYDRTTIARYLTNRLKHKYLIFEYNKRLHPIEAKQLGFSEDRLTNSDL
jgi:hypothetical protein